MGHPKAFFGINVARPPAMLEKGIDEDETKIMDRIELPQVCLVQCFWSAQAPLVSRMFSRMVHLHENIGAQLPSWLSEPNRSTVFGQEALLPVSTVVPNWDKNYLISQESEVSSSKVPNVRLFLTCKKGAMVRQGLGMAPRSY